MWHRCVQDADLSHGAGSPPHSQWRETEQMGGGDEMRSKRRQHDGLFSKTEKTLITLKIHKSFPHSSVHVSDATGLLQDCEWEGRSIGCFRMWSIDVLGCGA